MLRNLREFPEQLIGSKQRPNIKELKDFKNKIKRLISNWNSVVRNF